MRYPLEEGHSIAIHQDENIIVWLSGFIHLYSKEFVMTIQKLAAAAVAGFTLFSSITPAMAQYYPYPQPPQRPYYGGPGYDPRYGGQEYYSPRRRVVLGEICETSRGACQIRPSPEGSRCRCNIPGFGPKRGAVVGQGGW
jgi:hypothetical protein